MYLEDEWWKHTAFYCIHQNITFQCLLSRGVFFLFFSLLYLSCSCHLQLSLLTPIEFKESQKFQAAVSQLYSWDRLQGIAQTSRHHWEALGSQRPGASTSLHPCWANGKKAPCSVSTNPRVLWRAWRISLPHRWLPFLVWASLCWRKPRKRYLPLVHYMKNSSSFIKKDLLLLRRHGRNQPHCPYA